MEYSDYKRVHEISSQYLKTEYLFTDSIDDDTVVIDIAKFGFGLGISGALHLPLETASRKHSKVLIVARLWLVCIWSTSFCFSRTNAEAGL